VINLFMQSIDKYLVAGINLIHEAVYKGPEKRQRETA